MARTHELLSRDLWRGAPLDELVRATLKPYLGTRGEISIAGPPVVIDPKTISILGMVLYELASNAARHGALGERPGRLAVDWSVERREAGEWLVLRWKETRGEALRPPETGGFGTSFIERSLSYELSGSATLTFEADGLACILEFPLEQAEEP